jgi:hypothetical protein
MRKAQYMDGCHILVYIQDTNKHKNENFIPLGYYTESSGNSLPTFWSNLTAIFKGQESYNRKPTNNGHIVSFILCS